jgi:hypothetical protein
LKDATALLEKVDEAIEALKYGGQVLRKDNNNPIRCRMCGIGWLPVSIPMDGQDMRLRRNNCGYWRTFGDVKSRPGWEGQTPRQ